MNIFKISLGRFIAVGAFCIIVLSWVSYSYPSTLTKYIVYLIAALLLIYAGLWRGPDMTPKRLSTLVSNRFKKIKFSSLFKEYFEDAINADELNDELKWQYLGEIEMFKDLSAGKLDSKSFTKDKCETELFIMFPHIKDKMRNELAQKLIKKMK